MLMIMIHILNLSNMNTNKNFRIGMIQCFIFATRVKRCQECVGQLNSIFFVWDDGANAQDRALFVDM